MPMQTGGAAIVDALIANGIDTVFGLPGAQMDPVFAALHDRQDKIKIYHTRHEQGCAYMAYGYAESTNKTGVCLVVPGPGLLNASAAIATAYACNTPMLVVSGQLFAPMIDKGFGSLHEIKDQYGLAQHLVKWSDRMMHPADAPGRIASALSEIRRGRPRPVYVEMPFDTAMQKTAVPDPEIAKLDHANPVLDGEKIEAAAKALATAKNPIICVGGGAMDAGDAILALADKIDAPVVVSQNGLGAIDSRNKRVFTQTGCYALWKEADLAIGFGTRFYPAALSYGRRDLTLFKIDIDPTELFKLPPPVNSILGDAAEAATAIADAAAPHLQPAPAERAEWVAAAKRQVVTDLASVAPQKELLDVIREEITEDGILVSDLTQLYFASQDAYPVYKPRTYIQPSYQGTLGHAVGTALGAKVGNPDKPVVCLAGDGGFMFAVQELATAAQYNIGVVFLLMNDNAFGNVKRILHDNYEGRNICADLSNPDFVKLAQSFGIEAQRISGKDNLRKALRSSIAASGPALIEYEAPEFPSPWPLIHRPPVR